MAYTGPDFVNDGPPAINAANLNGMVTELERCSVLGDETEDIRIGANGYAYSSAGDAVRGQVDDLNDRVDSSAHKIQFIDNNVNDKYFVRHLNHKQFRLYTPHVTVPFSIYTDGRTFIHDFDITSYKNASTYTYYVAPNGAARNDGLSPATPKRLQDFMYPSNTLYRDNTTLILLDGVYRDFAIAQSSGNNTIRKNYNLIAQNPGKAIIANIGAELTWVLDSTYTSCFRTTRSNVLKCMQLYNDEFLMLKQAASASDCNDTLGTWYLDASNNLYVHLFFDETPTYNNFFPLLAYSMPALNVDSETQNVNLYIEGINFLGGKPATVIFSNSVTYAGSKLYANKCKFLGAYDNNVLYDSVSILGCDAYFVECEARYSSKDGFNYHAKNTVTGKFIEINCIASENGTDGFSEGNPYNNGSTAHDGYKGIRIGGTYYDNYGTNVADVHVNTVTENIMCTAFDSGFKGTSRFNCDYSAQQAGTTMYLNNCTAFGSRLSAECTSGASMYITNCDLEKDPEGAGTIIIN